jgi:hypothetical protein
MLNTKHKSFTHLQKMSLTNMQNNSIKSNCFQYLGKIGDNLNQVIQN